MTSLAPAQSALEPAGVQAAHVEELFWGYFDVAALVFILVLGALVVALAKRRTPDAPERKKPVVIGATVITAVTLVVLLVMSVVTGRALASIAHADAVKVDVTGYRWWWKFEYPDAEPSKIVTTTYELHVPVGRPIELRLRAADVIHSLWVPSLSGKRDLIPGKNTTLLLRADRPGRYEGMCAEFCGLQHANMRFVVVAETQEQFDAWRAAALAPARPPADAVAQRGQDVFMKSRCPVCHTIAGTEARGTVGPPLTHVASRRTIGQGTAPNEVGHLAGWIVDPQSTKPGIVMPGTPFASEDLMALLAYLGGLR